MDSELYREYVYKNIDSEDKNYVSIIAKSKADADFLIKEFMKKTGKNYIYKNSNRCIRTKEYINRLIEQYGDDLFKSQRELISSMDTKF